MGKHSKETKTSNARKVIAGATLFGTGALPVIVASDAQAATLTAQQVAEIAKRNCPQLSAAQINTAVKISWAESGWNTTAHNANGENSKGLWQINQNAHGLKYGDLFNPDNNARAMCAISNGGNNWRPWTVYTKGLYLSAPGYTGPVGTTPKPTTPTTPAPATDVANEVLRLVNAERAKVGAKALVLDSTLNTFALNWSKTQESQGRMYHSNLDFPGSPRGENVAMGYSTAEAVVNGWMNSPGHKANILNKSYTKMGLGKSGKYWTQVFAGGVVTSPVPPAPSTPAPSKGESKRPESIYKHDHYKVVAGDTLSGIAVKLKVEGGWKELHRWNTKAIPNPNLIYPGQEVNVPNKDSRPHNHTPATPAKPVAEKPKTPVSNGFAHPIPGKSPNHAFGTPGNYTAGYHTGTDFSAPTGTRINAIANGTVVTATRNGGAYGNYVMIKHDDGKYSLYAHMNSLSVRLGTRVTAGQQVGTVGSTGNSTGPHLHLEVRNSTAYGNVVDPVAYLRSKGVSI